MTKEEFNQFWTSSYPNTIPIQHYFRHQYADRWFRIHSLPESQRYAYTPEEWEILLSRHNQIITDLLGNHSKVLLVTGDYNYNSPEDKHIVEEESTFQAYTFTLLDNIDLNSLSPDEHEPGEVYRPAFAETIWSINQHNALLKELADGQLRTFFVSIKHQLIVAPYDGGIDFILKDSQMRDAYKLKYQDWLSKLPSGL
jgi:hypothetical protein